MYTTITATGKGVECNWCRRPLRLGEKAERTHFGLRCAECEKRAAERRDRDSVD